MWRNERTLYKRKCDLCGTEMLAMYPADAKFSVYCGPCWWSDRLDPLTYGQSYDSSKPFFEQFGTLVQAVPRVGFYQLNCINSPYANLMGNSKNAYLSYSLVRSEEVYYSYSVDDSFMIFDCAHVGWLQNSYDDVYCGRSNKIHCSLRSHDCVDSWFLFDCVNCQNCVMCSNLRNKRYCIRNQQYGKDEYFKKLKEEFDFGSYRKLTAFKKEFETMAIFAIHRFSDLLNCTNSTGDMIMNTKNTYDAFQGHDMEDCRYIIRALNIKDCYDTSYTTKSERLYEYASGGEHNANLRFTLFGWDNLRDSEYTEYCGSSSNLFGCIGVRNKQYCILNKQYAKSEYEQLVPKIKSQMLKTGEYGEHFPMSISPFAYNETTVQEFFPLTKGQAFAQGYRWKNPEVRSYRITQKPDDLPDHINNVDDSILREIIQCEHNQRCTDQCTQAFRIVSQELAWYRH
ncbi:MAG TPA: hypothetical protein VJH89_00175, partial [Patescibacteria group bacterium]|nr:hypothetical protein [Patescibacteria group bacterium]